MKVGLQMIFQNYDHALPDSQVVEEEVLLGELAEDLGWDELWPVEHHFTDYAACPDNLVFLANLGARTSAVKLATGAVIIPWNTPIRVVEKLVLLDHLTKGRVVFGMGRGLARREYAGFGIDMEESRDRFDEAAPMILEALETGVIKGDGPYYPQAPTEIRPAPFASFKGRTYCVAMSPDSVLQAAKLGANMVVFSNSADERMLEGVEAYRVEYAKHHDGTPPAPRFCDFMVCTETEEEGRELAQKHIGAYFISVMRHYELLAGHFEKSKAYKNYGDAVQMLRAMDAEDIANAYISCQAYGTPDQILKRLDARRNVIGDYELNLCTRFTGLSLAQSRKSMELFAKEVLPTLKTW